MNVAGARAARTSSAYADSLAWLYRLQQFGIKLGLENIRRLLEELELGAIMSTGDVQIESGGLQSAVGSQCKIIHVAGTNGKGSVCAMVEALCRAEGYRTGLFTSPHLVTFRERIRVNGQMISEEDVAKILTEIRELVATWDPHPTFFEVTTALALKHFAQCKPDVLILETGLGGRLDATNAVASSVAVLTPIDFDHQKWLGQSLDKIAAEKAGIIKMHRPIVSSVQAPEAEKVIRARAAQCEASIQFVDGSYQATPVGLPGTHQQRNAALALAALNAADIYISEAAIARGLASVQWPARFQVWDERTIIDGAHNPAAARVLAQTWTESFQNRRATLILAVLSDKDVRRICEELAPITQFAVLPTIKSERALPPNELAQAFANIAPKLEYFVCDSVGQAFAKARTKPEPILVTGSLHFAGEALAYLEGRPGAFEECAQ